MLDLKTLIPNQNSKYGELSNGNFEVKKSKFYSYIFKAEDLKYINSKLDEIRKDNKKARHIVYAYNFKDNLGITNSKFSNDGEPQATGVNSIISMLEKEEVYNYFVVIVRYFGGTLLGTGVLLRSYLASFKDAYIKLKQKF